MASAAQRVLTIGGGFSGMSAAIELRKRGVDVDPIEIDSAWRSLARGVSLLALALAVLPQTALCADAPAPARTGAEIYAKVCSLCHETRVGPVLLGRQLPGVVVATFVRHGMNGMPAFRPSEISDAELADLARFINTTPAAEARK